MRIDVLTLTPIDHYFRLYSLEEDKYLRRDYDEVTYCCYSYHFSGPALQLKAPSLTLESGTELQTTGATELYKDDMLVSMTAQNPKPDDKDAVSDYGSIKNNIKYQYYLSDSELLSYANVQWKGAGYSCFPEWEKISLRKSSCAGRAESNSVSFFKQ